MSLGADSGRVQRMILMEGGVLLVAGLFLGVGARLPAPRAANIDPAITMRGQ